MASMLRRRNPLQPAAIGPVKFYRCWIVIGRLPHEITGLAVAKRGKIVLLHFAGQMPLAGIAWQAMQYLVGLEKLGYEAWYVEDHGANPYDPRISSVVMECDYNLTFLR